MKSALFSLRNHFFTKNPILVIDRVGLIGEPFSLKLAKEFPVVFVSRINPNSDKKNQNLIHVPFSGKFPSIPDGKYSHIVFIDEEVSDSELLPKLIDKVKDVNSDFIVVLGLSEGKNYAADKIIRLYSSTKIVLLGDIFDNKLILRRENFKSTINKYIYQAQKFGKIQILGEGLKDAYAVYLNDVVDGLIDLVFGMHKSYSLFYIFPKHPPTELSLAHMIQKVNPEVTIDFIRRDPRIGGISYPLNGKYLLDDKYPLMKKIRKIDIKNKARVQDDNLHVNTKKLNSFPLFMIWTLIFLFFSPLIFTGFFAFAGENILRYAKEETDKGNFVNAKSSLHLSQTFFYLGKQALNVFSFQAKIVGQENNSRNLFKDIEFGYKISESLLQAFNSGTYFSKILNGTSKNPAADLATGENYLKSSVVLLNKIRAEEKISAQISQKLEIINPLIKLLSSTSDIMPNILGMEGERNYLILFQNNMELRPGGGFIDSYGILKLNMGKITQFTIHDVSDADKQLRGHVEPPFAIRRYLSEKHWYMKDSNFDVDFVKSALSSSSFIFAETGLKTDGVIATDLTFAKSILRALGPVYIADYKEAVDENNLYSLMQKKDFSKSLYGTIITKITKTKVSYLLIAQAISDALTKKNLLLAFNNDFQNIFTVNGWSSSLWDKRENSKELINDFLGINEANLGHNNANYFVKRQASQNVKIEPDGSLFGEINLSYKNTSASPPGGDYKNYLRIILPLNASISSISVNDVSQSIVDAVTDSQTYEAKNFKVPAGLEVEKMVMIENKKTIYGFLVNIPAGELVKIKIQYAVLRKNALDPNNFSYNLKIFKQPGVDTLPYSFSLYYPDNLNVINAEGLKKEENVLSHSEDIMGDKELTVSFAAK